MLTDLPLLSVLIWFPIVGAILILMTGGDVRANWARGIAVVVAVVSLLLSIPLYTQFNTQTEAMQFVEHVTWLSALPIHYDLGVDGLSMPLVCLSSFTTFVVVLVSLNLIKKQVAQYMAAFLMMQSMMVGVFAATDAILFYIFWEAMLIPVYLCIGMWGGLNRHYASIKFFLYTFFGSALMLVAILYLFVQADSFSIADFYPVRLNMTEQIAIFIAFLLAFAVKVPMWPVHTWLPDAHTEAPAGGSVILAALMLKMGVYGFLRFSLPIAPDASQSLHYVMIALSLIAIVYIGFVAIVQTDMKRLIAYSSISHMGLVTLGCFMIYPILGVGANYPDAYMSMEGAIVQMVSHAFSTGALFIGVGIIYETMHSRLIKDYGGVVNKMPIFTSFMMLFAMANVGLPGTSGFVGEFMVLLSAFKTHFWIAVVSAFTLILSAAYTLWMFKRVFFGTIVNEKVNELTEINCVEKIVFGILAFGVLALGVYPQILLNVLHPTVSHLLHLSIVHKI